MAIKFSIIIPTRNRASQVVSLVHQLTKQQYPRNDFEIIVVDNQSTDETVDQLRLMNSGPIRIYTEPSQGPAFCRNKGYALARNQHVLFLDDDIRVNTNFLQKLKTAWQQHPSAAVLGGRIMPEPFILNNAPMDIATCRSLLKKYDWVFACVDYGYTPKRIGYNDLLCSACMSINKKCLPNRLKPFNTVFGTTYLGILIFAEDFEFCTRQILEGKQVWYVPTLSCFHSFGRERFTQLYLIKRHLIAGAERFLMDNTLCHHYPQYARYTMGHDLIMSIKSILRGRRDYYSYKKPNLTTLVFFFSYLLLGPWLVMIAHNRLRTN